MRRPRAIRKNAHKKKRRHPNVFGPGGIEGLADLAGEMFLLSMLRRFGIRGRDIVAFTVAAQAAGRAETAARAEAKTCKCGGDCPCHTVPIYGGIPCPPDCPTRHRFDGCHRCDCPTATEKVQ